MPNHAHPVSHPHVLRPLPLALLLALSTLALRPAQAQGTAATLPAVTVNASSAPTEAGTPAAGGFSTKGARIGVLGERPLLDTPFSVNVISAEQMENAGVRDLKNITRLDPALSPSFAGTGYYDAVSIRGLTLNNWTNYYKNGLLFANQAKTALENVERVEVLRGLSGFMQGFAAPGGTVNYVTERPTATWQRSAELYLDEFGSVLPGIDIGGPLTEDGRLGIRLNATGGTERFFVDRIRTQRAFGSMALDWEATPDVTVRFDAQLDRRDGQGTQPALGLASDGSLLRNIDPSRHLGQRWDRYDTRTREAGLDVEWRFAPRWRVGARTNYAHLYRDDFSANIDNVQPNGDFTIFEYKSPDETRVSRNSELAVRGELALQGTLHELAFGVTQRQLVARFGDGVYAAAGTSNVYAPVDVADPGTPAPPSYEAFRNRDGGFFVSDFITFNERWQALVGLRQAKVNFASVFSARPYQDSVTTPALALIHKPLPNVSVYASYSEGLEQGATAPVGAVNANQQLQPVTAKQKEVGVKAEWMGGALTSSAALFETRVPFAYLDAASNTFDYRGNRVHRGLEFTLTGSPWRGGRLNGGLVLLDAKVANGNIPANEGKVPSGVAEKQFSLWLDQRTPVPGLTAQVGVRGNGPRAITASNSAFAPGWAALDLGVRYATRVSGQRLELGLNLLNAANKTYIESTGSGQLLYGSTRALTASARMDF